MKIVDRAGNSVAHVPVLGAIEPLLHVIRGRWFLEPLEYGKETNTVLKKRFRLSAEGAWKILNLTTDLPEATFEIKELQPGTREVRLRFPEDALKRGLPFGSFLQRTLRVETDISGQPLVEICSG